MVTGYMFFRITYRPWVKGYGRSVGDPKAAAMGGLHLALAWMKSLHGCADGTPFP